MKRAGKKMTKAEVADVRAFVAGIEALLVSLGAERNDHSVWDATAIRGLEKAFGSVVGYEWTLRTPAGPLVLHPGDMGVMCRFLDIDRAVRLLSAWGTHVQNFNHHSGKWNHHYFEPWIAADAVVDFTTTITTLLARNPS